ncbi:MAG: UDP-N-acetylmuramate dehydrogenase [Deltaproteobacteria bacterium]|nr:MAG: UDP-N-acetylmuramate dehydrogenase [Deltaproteobacteria bacterium]
MRVYLLGIAGTGMGSFAGLLRKAGHEVSGSDENVYPPMSDKLAEWKIRVFTPYSADNLKRAEINLAVVGNVLRADNVEAKAVRRVGIPHMSFPEALEELFLTKQHPVVIVGTHGKTTTTAICAQVLTHAGRDPSMLVGGVPLNFNEGFRLGGGEHFVIEGDEYDTAYFDKGPKFLHYRPRTSIFTGAEFDHADIYRDTAQYESAFEKFFPLLPQDGYLAACSAFPNWKRLASFYAACRALGLKPDEIAAGFRSFRGVKRRQELRGEVKGVAVIDDFAHHPTAVRETIAAVLAQYPGRRLVAVFEPRSNTAMRKIHQEEYAHAFRGADETIISQPTAIAKVPENERIDAKRMAQDIADAGTRARWMESPDAIVLALAKETRSGDVVLAMSNGGFGGLHDKLLEALGTRA